MDFADGPGNGTRAVSFLDGLPEGGIGATAWAYPGEGEVGVEGVFVAVSAEPSDGLGDVGLELQQSIEFAVQAHVDHPRSPRVREDSQAGKGQGERLV